jgi:hypothetical protein
MTIRPVDAGTTHARVSSKSVALASGASGRVPRPHALGHPENSSPSVIAGRVAGSGIVVLRDTGKLRCHLSTLGMFLGLAWAPLRC